MPRLILIAWNKSLPARWRDGRSSADAQAAMLRIRECAYVYSTPRLALLVEHAVVSCANML